MRFTEFKFGQRIGMRRQAELRARLVGVEGLIVRDSSLICLAGHESEVGRALVAFMVPLLETRACRLESMEAFSR